MLIDKELYRQAYQQYQQWNEAEKKERLHHAEQLSPAEAWRRYVELVEFCWRLAPQQSQWQREQRLADWDRYYARVRQLEAWRRAHGKTT
jgi:hypothetical protein